MTGGAGPGTPATPPGGVRAVVLDSGETLFDETRTWSVWAERLGVPPFTLFVALGGVLAQGRPFHEVFDRFEPGFDYAAELDARSLRDRPHVFTAADLHPDVVGALTALRDRGVSVFVAGNYTPEGVAAVRALGLPVAGVLASCELGARNDEPAFFERVLKHLQLPAGAALYVSHRLDTALPSARLVGLRTLYLQRGPIAHILLGTPADRRERTRIRDLAHLPPLLEDPR